MTTTTVKPRLAGGLEIELTAGQYRVTKAPELLAVDVSTLIGWHNVGACHLYPQVCLCELHCTGHEPGTPRRGDHVVIGSRRGALPPARAVYNVTAASSTHVSLKRIA